MKNLSPFIFMVTCFLIAVWMMLSDLQLEELKDRVEALESQPGIWWPRVIHTNTYWTNLPVHPPSPPAPEWQRYYSNRWHRELRHLTNSIWDNDRSGGPAN